MDPYNYSYQSSSIPEEDYSEEHLDTLEKEYELESADYYAILNVSKKATDDEIKEAYKKLCRFFHPDKHTNDEKKQLAESRFQIIQKAYEVLSDPQRRVIYDTYGEQGLTARWDVGPRYKTTEELRDEYEKLARIKREQELENLVRSRASFHVNLDASGVLFPYEPPVFTPFGEMAPRAPKRFSVLRSLGNTQIKQLFMSHSFETPLGPQTRGIIAGSMLSRSGMGGGNITGTIRHTISSQLWGEFSANLLNPRAGSLKTFYSPSSDSFVNTSIDMRTFRGPPMLSVTTGRRLFSTTTGYLTYRTGDWALGPWGQMYAARSMEKSSVALGLAGNTKLGQFNAELQTGIIASHLTASYTRKIAGHVRVRVSGALSSINGVVATIGSDHVLTKHTRFGMSMECGVPTGVVVKFRVSRLGQKIVVPIVLTAEYDTRLALFGAVLPATIALAVDHFVLKPRRKQQVKARIQELREQHSDYLSERKREALDAQKLLEELAERKKGQESRKADGLVIVEAKYGRYEDLSTEDGTTDHIVDVTVVIQTLVNESRLTIPGGYSKSNILGFYDPCFGERKALLVVYRFQNQLHRATVEDRSPLTCPMRAHAV